jgi:hypothetical protein
MRTDLTNLKNFLDRELSYRKNRSPSYSKRAFARDLGISSTALNEFLDGKRALSFKNIDNVFSYLNSKIFCSWCDKDKKKTKFIIGGPRRQFICDTCLTECSEIIKEGRLQNPTLTRHK